MNIHEFTQYNLLSNDIGDFFKIRLSYQPPVDSNFYFHSSTFSILKK